MANGRFQEALTMLSDLQMKAARLSRACIGYCHIQLSDFDRGFVILRGVLEERPVSCDISPILFQAAEACINAGLVPQYRVLMDQHSMHCEAKECLKGFFKVIDKSVEDYRFYDVNTKILSNYLSRWPDYIQLEILQGRLQVLHYDGDITEKCKELFTKQEVNSDGIAQLLLEGYYKNKGINPQEAAQWVCKSIHAAPWVQGYWTQLLEALPDPTALKGLPLLSPDPNDRLRRLLALLPTLPHPARAIQTALMLYPTHTTLQQRLTTLPQQ